MDKINYQKINSKILEVLPQRQKKVILRRFGLENREKETLEKIGQDFGVTRERVRQIEVDAFKSLERKKEERDLKKVFSLFEQYLKEKGGLKREDILLTDLAESKFQNHVFFLLTFGDYFHRFPEDQELYSFWTIERNLFQKIKGILENAVKKFEKEKKPLPEKDFFSLAKKEKNPEIFSSVVEIAKRIEKGPLGYFGLVDWSEIKPRGVRDKAYLTLKKTGKPLHFREIATLASNLEGEVCKKREVFSQSVHNELIRDERFVWVGRGIYALREWGYSPGTVRKIIQGILQESKNPLSKEEIIAQVLAQRLVKENTILLNLQDKNFFLKDAQERYRLK